MYYILTVIKLKYRLIGRVNFVPINVYLYIRISKLKFIVIVLNGRFR